MKRQSFSCLFLMLGVISCAAQELNSRLHQSTPSNSQYFSWINNTNKGPASAQTLINFEFFGWMKEEFGMVLDIYAFDAFDRMMSACREYSPDLILLNHRLDLGPGTKHSTTYLFGGAETYIDVHLANDITASHHRACALKRELPPGLTCLTEDYGVCLSSCLDYWEDDLILQAFNRNLILAPQIYTNPWLLNWIKIMLIGKNSMISILFPLNTPLLMLPNGSFHPQDYLGRFS